MIKEKPVVVDNKTIGQRIKQIREESGISQEKLGEMAGVTYQQIQKYEKGVNKVSAERLAMIAKALKTPVEFFLESLIREPIVAEKGKTEPYGILSKKRLTIMEQELLDCFRLLPDKKAKSNLIGLLKSFNKLR